MGLVLEQTHEQRAVDGEAQLLHGIEPGGIIGVGGIEPADAIGAYPRGSPPVIPTADAGGGVVVDGHRPRRQGPPEGLRHEILDQQPTLPGQCVGDGIEARIEKRSGTGQWIQGDTGTARVRHITAPRRPGRSGMRRMTAAPFPPYGSGTFRPTPTAGPESEASSAAPPGFGHPPADDGCAFSALRPSAPARRAEERSVIGRIEAPPGQWAWAARGRTMISLTATLAGWVRA